MAKLDEVLLQNVVTTVLEIPKNQFSDQLKLGDCMLWDSLGHMNLICSIESAFSVRFDSAEIAELKSVSKIKEALNNKL